MSPGVDGQPSDFATVLGMRARILMRQDGPPGQSRFSASEAWNDTLLNTALRTYGIFSLSPEQTVVDRVVRLRRPFAESVEWVKEQGGLVRDDAVSSLFIILGIDPLKAAAPVRVEASLAQASGGGFAEAQVAELRSLMARGRPLEDLLGAIRTMEPEDRALCLRQLCLPEGLFLKTFLEGVRGRAGYFRNRGMAAGVYDLWTTELLVWSLRASGRPVLLPAELWADRLIRDVSCGEPGNNSKIDQQCLPQLAELIEALRPRYLRRGQVDPDFQHLVRPVDSILSPESARLYAHLFQLGKIEDFSKLVEGLSPEMRAALAIRRHYVRGDDKFGVYKELVGRLKLYFSSERESNGGRLFDPREFWIESLIASALRTVQSGKKFYLTTDQQFVDGVVRYRYGGKEAWQAIPSDRTRIPTELNRLGQFLWLRFEAQKTVDQALQGAMAESGPQTAVEKFVVALVRTPPDLKACLDSRRREWVHAQYLRDAMNVFVGQISVRPAAP